MTLPVVPSSTHTDAGRRARWISFVWELCATRCASLGIAFPASNVPRPPSLLVPPEPPVFVQPAAANAAARTQAIRVWRVVVFMLGRSLVGVAAIEIPKSKFQFGRKCRAAPERAEVAIPDRRRVAAACFQRLARGASAASEKQAS